jgi:peptidoglycan hydrolase-like protein with peptidoglycan-binding domain
MARLQGEVNLLRARSNAANANLARVNSGSAPTRVGVVPPGVVLKRGDSGLLVRELQRLLRARGFNVAITGRFEARTLAALRSFQSRVALHPSAAPITRLGERSTRFQLFRRRRLIPRKRPATIIAKPGFLLSAKSAS